MNEWWAQASYPPIPEPIDDDTAAAMTRALPGFGIVTATPAHTVIEMTIEAGDLKAATAAALTAAEAAWANAGTNGEAAGLRVVTAAERDRELAHPDPINLLGVSGIADRLGVTKQRADELTGLADFPDPIGNTPAGRVWTVDSVDRFNARWERKPGRPHKQ